MKQRVNLFGAVVDNKGLRLFRYFSKVVGYFQEEHVIPHPAPCLSFILLNERRSD
jgi:hypothetical protein